MTGARKKFLSGIIVATVLLLITAIPALASDKSEPAGDPVVEPATLRCLGVYWVIQGDDNAKARIEMAYRKTGAGDWKPAPPLFRVAKGANKDKAITLRKDAWLFAGSAIDVPEGTHYDIRLRLIDPDGGDLEKIVRAHTIAEPIVAANAPLHHVIPGAGGGSGSKVDPYKGIAEAEKHATPGDVFLLHDGTYDGQWEVRRSGEEGKPIVWRGAGDGEAILQADLPIGKAGYPAGHVIEAAKKHDVWFEKLTIRGQAYSDLSVQESYRIVVRRCRLEPFLYGIVGQRNESGKLGGFFIADNIIHGRQPWPATSKQWEDIGENRAIWLGGAGNVVCYNRIDHCKDGIDTADGPVTVAFDIHNNDVSECYDDGSEMDGSNRNCRNFLNRYVDTLTGLSFQPVHGGPIYAYRNVVYNTRGEFLKFHNSPSGAVVVHNTFVHFGPLLHVSTPEEAENCYLRNNLFVGTGGAAIDWDLPIKWMDMDYDGFAGFSPGATFLHYNHKRYATPADVRAKAPIEKHLVVVDLANLFASGIAPPEPGADYNADAPGYSWTTGLRVYDATKIDLRLNAKSAAAGAGEALAGFNDAEEGNKGNAKRADLGAYPVGASLPQYGPRADQAP